MVCKVKERPILRKPPISQSLWWCLLMVHPHNQKVEGSSFQYRDISEVQLRKLNVCQVVGCGLQVLLSCEGSESWEPSPCREKITFSYAVWVGTKLLSCTEHQDVLLYVIQYTDAKVAHNIMQQVAIDSQLNRPAKNHIIVHRGNCMILIWSDTTDKTWQYVSS